MDTRIPEDMQRHLDGMALPRLLYRAASILSAIPRDPEAEYVAKRLIAEARRETHRVIEGERKIGAMS